jgi:CRISPR/Cas system CSM-associated protein Csm3 (group 7 of RAMP superfamily)
MPNPGCGIGSELVNNFVPRTVDGFPCLPASHIRGLVRQNLLDLENRNSWSELSMLFWERRASTGMTAIRGAVRFGDAISEKKRTLVLSRTAIDDWGKAKETSLRTVELIPAGTDTGTGTGTDTYTLLRGVWSIDAAPGTVKTWRPGWVF